ncbi:MAG TPA: hypothetical protein PLR17_06845 [Acetomicrobium flavidum]|uniref:hypothetical protein n=1 Tax=Acetomicrobium flavidum TaxID=49896 RepID=UPI002C77E5D1|nr:hypothetical protein [Acetomicrobium flavidum]
MKTRNKYLLIALAAVIAIVALAVAGVNMGTGIVKEMAPKAAKDALGIDLTLKAVSGNPIKGYSLKGIVLSKGSEEILSIDQVGARPSLTSLIKGKVYLASLTLNGAHFDFDKTLELAKSFKPSGAGEGLPLGSIFIKSSEIKGPFGTIDLKDVEITPHLNVIKAKLDASYNGLSAKGNAALSIIDGVKIEELNLKIAEGEISLSGPVGPELGVEGTIKNLDIERIKDIWAPLKDQKLAGKLGGHIKLTGKIPDIRGTGDITFNDGMLVGIPVKRASANWKYEGESISFSDISADVLNGTVSGGLAMSLRNLPPHLNLNLQAKEINLDTIAKSYPQVSGMLSGTLDSVATNLSGMPMTLSGSASLTASNLTVKGQPLKDVKATLQIKEGKRININASSRWNDAPIKAVGYVDLPGGPSVDLTLSWQRASIERIKALLPALKQLPIKGYPSGEIALRGSLKDMSLLAISGKVWSDSLTVAKEEIKSPVANFRFKGNELNIDAFSASWRKASIKGKGVISGLPKAATLNVEGNVHGLNVSDLDQFVPQLSQYNISGVISSQWTLKGPLNSPELSLDFNSDRLSLSGITVKGITGSTSLKPLAKPIAGISASIRASSLGTPSFALLQDLSVSIDASADKINIGQAKGNLLGGELQASGQVTMPAGKSPQITLTATANKIKLSHVKDLGFAFPLEGMADVKANITGSIPDLLISAEASSPELTIAGFVLSNVAATVEGSQKALQIKSLTAKAGGGSLTASGSVNYDKAVNLKLDLTGNGLDLKELSKKIDEKDKYKINGTMDITASVTYDEKGLKGHGEAKSPQAGIYGLKATDIKVPFSLADNKLTCQNISASFYEGSVAGVGSISLASTKWDASATVTGTNLDLLLHDLFPLEGHITGKAKIQFKGNGLLGKHLDGSGSFSVSEGHVSDFKIVKTIAKAYGKSTIDYRSIEGRYTLNSLALTLLPGTQAYAPKGDPMYTYFGADGTVKYDGKLNLSCYGNLNVQAINAIVGGIKGGVLAAESLESALEGFLSGLLQAGQKSDYRDVTFKLTGTIKSPKISNFNVSRPEGETESSQDITSIQGETPGETKQESPEDVIKKTILEKIFNQ